MRAPLQEHPWMRWGLIDYGGPNSGTIEEREWAGDNCEVIVTEDWPERIAFYEGGPKVFVYKSGTDSYMGSECDSALRAVAGDHAYLMFTDGSPVVVYNDPSRLAHNLFNEDVRGALVSWIEEFVRRSGADGIFLDNSGGVLYNHEAAGTPLLGGHILPDHRPDHPFNVAHRAALVSLVADLRSRGIETMLNNGFPGCGGGRLHEFSDSDPYRLQEPRDPERVIAEWDPSVDPNPLYLPLLQDWRGYAELNQLMAIAAYWMVMLPHLTSADGSGASVHLGRFVMGAPTFGGLSWMDLHTLPIWRLATGPVHGVTGVPEYIDTNDGFRVYHARLGPFLAAFVTRTRWDYEGPAGVGRSPRARFFLPAGEWRGVRLRGEVAAMPQYGGTPVDLWPGTGRIWWNGEDA